VAIFRGVTYFCVMVHARRFKLRDARESDFSFAEALYLGTMEPLLSELDDWDQDKFSKRIRALFKAQECQVIIVDGRDIGFMQVIETVDDLNIAQLHLAEGYRGLGIGTQIAADLIARSERDGKTISLSVPRNNLAIELYKRLGFKVSRDDGESIIDMLRNPDPANAPRFDGG
jgi:ribosomal protein S18 acetylase RimI-like enzyme